LRRDILDILICPRCKSGKFSLQTSPVRDEIVQGLLICEICAQEFNIDNGIPDLIYNPSRDVIDDQRKAAALKKRFMERAHCEQIPADKRLFCARRGHLFAEPNGREYVAGTEKNVNDMIPFMNLGKSQRVLELGAGTCWSTAKLAKDGCRCVATDISVALKLELGDAFFEEDGVFFERVQACMQNLPFADDTFDVVFATTALHHAPDLTSVFGEVHRVLKSGGRLYATNEPVLGIFNFSARRQFLKKDPIHHGAVEMPYNLWHWVRALKKSGLDPVIYFPGYLDSYLRNGPARTFFGKIARLAWRIKMSRYALLRWILYPLTIVWNPGICLGITAVKNRRAGFWCPFITVEP